MKPRAFVDKWSLQQGTERATAQAHYLDLCELLKLPKPQEFDATGKEYGFEVGLRKAGGEQGFADVYRQGCFALEYKGKHKDLTKAYTQLRQYASDLGNPPFLIVSDIERIVIRTNWTNTVTVKHEIALHDLIDGYHRNVLEAALTGSETLKPKETRADLTSKIARGFADVAEKLRERGEHPEAVALLVSRMAFCMFAEDIGILPKQLFTDLLDRAYSEPEAFEPLLRDLFGAMSKGGWFGTTKIRHINGGLFRDAATMSLTKDEIGRVRGAARHDWEELDPTILGTLFERGLNPAKRASLGAHYTDEDSIAKIVEPVIVAPLTREWEAARDGIIAAKTAMQKRTLYAAFRERLDGVSILDPACGSGNFLYVALKRLLDLELRVINAAPALLEGPLTLEEGIPRCGPHNVAGIELNEYAAELARVSIWIGDLQWRIPKGFGTLTPVLQTLETVARRDALIGPDGGEAVWPTAEFIIGNPPFLGDKRMRESLGDAYVDRVRTVYKGRVGGGADFVTYWFARAGEAIRAGTTRRTGFVATNGIRKGQNSLVLRGAIEGGRIVAAHSDFPWHDEAGAAVRVSIVVFGTDAATDPDTATLDGTAVREILPDLTAVTEEGGVDLGTARPLAANRGRSFNGICLAGEFDVDDETARVWLGAPNVNGRPNSDVLRPLWNGQDLKGHWRGRWLIDFGPTMTEGEAAMYELPFQRLEVHVKEARATNREAVRAAKWWRTGRPRPEMRSALAGRSRFLATVETSKHRWFRWLAIEEAPEHSLVVLTTDEEWRAGVLSSRFHTEWATHVGNRLGVGNDPRYNSATTFQTFPFPDPSEAQRAEIAAAARELDALRTRWLDPPEWTREETLEFPATVGGPWDRLIAGDRSGEIGTARYVRRVAIRGKEGDLAKRTLTALYNENPAWLRDAHRRLDAAVGAAYGLAPDLPTGKVLAVLLERNRAITEGSSGSI